MKKRIPAILLTLGLLLTLLAVSAFADDAAAAPETAVSADEAAADVVTGGAAAETTAADSVAITAANFPDAAFRSFVSETYDKDGDGALSAAERAITGQYIKCSGLGITSLTGLEYFTGYIGLECYQNQLKELPDSLPSSLYLLNCWDNQLTSLDLSRFSMLGYLYCGNNNLQELDLSNNTRLKRLSCYSNPLTKLDVSMLPMLELLDCWSNQLGTLDVTHNPALTSLTCPYNQLKVLNLSKNTALTKLDCSNNLLTALDVSSNTQLTRLTCQNNQLTTLDISSNKGLNTASGGVLNYDESKTILIDFLFSDVQKDGDYYYMPVYWAYSHKPEQITSGTSKTTFSPNATCTRGQVVTFLWRAAGKPTVSGSNPFVDVKKSDYYYDAVLWAVSKGITKGTDSTHFSPNQKCTRGQVVTFMYRAAENPAAGSSTNPFTDVKTSDYFCSPVLWAVDQGITKGTSSTKFSPNATCTRGQVVTFLYRYLGQ